MAKSVFQPTQDAVVIGDGSMFVDIFKYEGDDLKTKTPSIGLFVQGQMVESFTWDEANEVAEALKRVAGVAEFG